jgi:uncharacterized protein (TIGR00255 family)
MAIRSMTGFGLAEALTPSGTYRVEIRGVNNRFLETQIRLPKFTANLESRIKKEINSIISRGSISVFISCDKEQAQTRLTWDKNSVDNYMQIFEEIQDTYNLPGKATLSDLLNFSDFIKAENISYDEEILWEHLQPVLNEAIRLFQDTRINEGAFIINELKKIIEEITRTLEQVELRAPERVTEYAKVLRERVQKLIENPPDPLRMTTEIALMAERMDISEECTRLRAHIAKFYQDIEQDKPVGKQLSFLLQEMNREANTIGSKANDTETSHLSVKLKELIEKIREQVQNIE